MAEGGALLRRYTVYPVSRVRIPLSPPAPTPQTCSAGLEAASGPAPRGAFCFGLLTAACGVGSAKSSQTPFVSKPHDFFGLGSEP